MQTNSNKDKIDHSMLYDELYKRVEAEENFFDNLISQLNNIYKDFEKR